MATPDAVQALMALGFNPLEAEVYTFLVQEAPATGYRIAQALGRPVAGVYKTIESLANKGALLLDEGESRLCRAIPPEELLGRLERTFQDTRASAARALAELGGSAADDRVYQLRSYEQVMERARSMLAGCRELAMIDGFPQPLEVLRPEVEATAARTRVSVLTYEPLTFAGAKVTLFAKAHPLVQSFPGHWLFLVTDGAELLLAFFGRDGRSVHQALWSGSAFLAFTLQSFMVSEFNHVSTMKDPETPPEVREIARRHAAFYPEEAPGFARLLRLFGERALPPHPHDDQGDTR